MREWKSFCKILVGMLRQLQGFTAQLKKGRDDDNVMGYAEEHKDSIIITQDQKLADRLKNRGIKQLGSACMTWQGRLMKF